MQIVYQSAHIDAQIHNIGSHVCSFAKNVVQSVSVFLLGLMGTNNFALVTIIGRLREEAQNALNHICTDDKKNFYITSLLN